MINLQNTLYDGLFRNATDTHLPGRDWRLLKAQAYQESKFDATAVSPVGAMGVLQIMPGTWDDIRRAGHASGDPYDPEQSIYAGAYYMATMLQKWTAPRPQIDRECLALASYNAGAGNLINAQRAQGGVALYGDIIKGLGSVTGATHTRETTEYVRRILAYYNELVLTR